MQNEKPKPKQKRNDGRAACDYCRSGEVFRRDQNCPKCGRRGLLAADHDRRKQVAS